MQYTKPDATASTPHAQLHPDYLKWRPLETAGDGWAVWRIVVDADGFQRAEYDYNVLDEIHAIQIAELLNREVAE